jgi:hypothetical protein
MGRPRIGRTHTRLPRQRMIVDDVPENMSFLVTFICSKYLSPNLPMYPKIKNTPRYINEGAFQL